MINNTTTETITDFATRCLEACEGLEFKGAFEGLENLEFENSIKCARAGTYLVLCDYSHNDEEGYSIYSSFKLVGPQADQIKNLMGLKNPTYGYFDNE